MNSSKTQIKTFCSGICLLIILMGGFQGMHSQVMVDGKLYPDLLWGEAEEDPSDFNKGGFKRIPEDFIVATGKLWEGEPPECMGSFVYDGRKISNCGTFNNQIIALILTGKEEDRKTATAMFKAGIRFDPRFFPFRYNFGRLLHIQNKFDDALIHFELAKAEIPEFYKTYIHIGILSELKNETYYAIESYKKAAALNKYKTEALVLLAEYYLKSGIRNRASIYLNEALKIDEESPDARVGFARLEINAGNYYQAYKILNETKLSTPEGREKDYSKRFHYYFAETASRVLDYQTSEDQYNILLKYPNDPFFADFSYKVIQRRRDISKKFAEAKKTQLEEDDIEINRNFK